MPIPYLTARRRFAVLAALAILVAVLMGVVSTRLLYREALRNEGNALQSVVESQARLLEAVFADEMAEGGGDAALGLEGALAQLRMGQDRFGGFGGSGEFTAAFRDGDQIRFLVGIPGDTARVPDAVPWASDRAEPMRRALSGESGVGRLRDYDGIRVLAAYTPVQGTGAGLVAKKDLAEVRAPYVRAMLVAWGVGLGVVVLAAGLAGFLGLPLLDELEVREAAHQAFLSHFPGVAFRARAGPDGTWRYDILEGEVLNLTGWPAEYFLRAPGRWVEMVVPEDREGFLRSRQLGLEGKDTTFGHEYRIRTRGGDEVWLHSVVEIKGRTAYGLHYDITHHHRLGEALSARDAELTTLISSLPGAAIHVLDQELRFVFSAGTVLADMGMSPDDLLGRTVDEVVEGDLAALARLVSRRVAKGETVRFTGAYQGRDFVFTAAPMRGSGGEVKRTLVLATDVTDERRRDRALAQSEAHLRQVIAAGHHGVFELDLVTGHAEVNSEYARHLGHDPDTFVETVDALRERTHPDDVAAVSAVFQDYRNGARKEHSLEFRQRGRDGTWRWIRSTGGVVARAADGTPTRVVGTHTNVTARKEMESALRERKRFLEAVLDHAPVMYCTFDRELELQFANPAFEAFFGWSLDEARALPDFLAEVYPDPRELRRVRDFIRDGGGVWGEFRPRLRDGSVRDAAFANVVLADGTSIGIGQDISQRKESEVSLVRSEELFRSAVESAPDGIFIETEGQFAFANQVAVGLFGVDRAEELVGRLVLDFIHPDDREEAASRIRALEFERASVPPREATIVRQDGSSVPCEFSAVPFSFNGRPGAMVFARDLTERRRTRATVLEQLEELRRWQDLMLDREDRVQELKREVNELSRRVGEEIPYPSQESGSS